MHVQMLSLVQERGWWSTIEAPRPDIFEVLDAAWKAKATQHSVGTLRTQPATKWPALALLGGCACSAIVLNGSASGPDLVGCGAAVLHMLQSGEHGDHRGDPSAEAAGTSDLMGIAVLQTAQLRRRAADAQRLAAQIASV